MLKLYHILFNVFLFLPFFGIVNSVFLNSFKSIQRTINNSIYICSTVICAYILILFSAYGEYDVYLYTVSKNIPLAFSANSFNLMFGFFILLIFTFINITFQKYFEYLNLPDKYKLYNKQFACIVFFCTLLSFSHSILLTIFLYISIIISSYFLITNPDLRDFRKKYSISFSTSFILCIFFMCILGFYYKYTENTFFTLNNLDKLKNIPSYWLAIIFVLLVLPIFFAPIYLFFKDRFYYEDFLPVFIIFFIPFVFCNTFLFFKVFYFIFYNSLKDITFYFFITNIIVIVLFILSCIFCIKNIKNNLKFTTLYCVSVFVVFLSQILFIHDNIELSYIFSNFLFLMLFITLSVLSNCGILFLLLKYGVTDTNILYKKTKNELNFHIICLFLPIIILIISLFNFNFNIRNVFCLINIIEIIILFFLYIFYVFYSINKKDIDKNKKPKEININKLNIFIPQIILTIISFALIILKSQIAKFIIYYK